MRTELLANEAIIDCAICDTHFLIQDVTRGYNSICTFCEMIKKFKEGKLGLDQFNQVISI